MISGHGATHGASISCPMHTSIYLLLLMMRCYCVRSLAVAGGRPGTMSYRPRVQSDADDRSFSVGGGRSRSGRTPSSAVDSWTSDNDITDTAWKRTMKSSSSTTNGGQFRCTATPRVVQLMFAAL